MAIHGMAEFCLIKTKTAQIISGSLEIMKKKLKQHWFGWVEIIEIKSNEITKQKYKKVDGWVNWIESFVCVCVYGNIVCSSGVNRKLLK